MYEKVFRKGYDMNIYDVAKKADVSISTVSRVLNKRAKNKARRR